MPIYKPSQFSETLKNQRFSMILYGTPGVGKTTLAMSAPNAILIDLDKGMQRTRARHWVDCLQINTYEEFLKEIELGALKSYDTLIVDTGGALITLLQDYVMRKDPVNKTKSGTISQKGYGAVKLEFQALTNRFKTVYDKNIIYVFHSVEEKNKDGIAIQRLLCEGSAKNIVWQPCDFGGYVYMNGDQRMIGFTPTDEYFAKGCYGIGGVRKIATLGDADKNDFITRMFAEANANIAKDNDFFQAEREEYEAVMEQGKKLIESWTKPEEFNNGGAVLGKLPHKLTSLVELRAIYKERVTALGFVWDSQKKAYVEPPKEQPAEEKAEQPEPKKKGRALADDILNGLGVKGAETDDSATKPDTATGQIDRRRNRRKNGKENRFQ